VIYLALLEAELPLLLYSICFIFGLLIGSFLNVVIYRLPIMMQREWESQANEILSETPDVPWGDSGDSAADAPDKEKHQAEPFNLVLPNSRCPHCGHKIKPWENIPLLSFLFLKGQCAECDAEISIRYPIVELATGILTVIVIWQLGANMTGLMASVFTWALICLALIDFDHTLLPDDITLPMLWLGLICNYFGLVSDFSSAFWGAVAGYVSLWTVFQVFRLVTGREGMGYGDFKMLAMLGAWLGWQQLPLIIILSSLAGAVIGGLLIATGRDKSHPIPYGPFLAIAGWVSLIWGSLITDTYLKFAAF